MIDEFQDIDELQYELMEVLCGYHKNLFIVGDPDQTIYTWRGANVKYLLDFDKQFPGTQHHLDAGQLPLHAGDPGGGELPDREEPKSHAQGAGALTRPSGPPVLCQLAESQEPEAAVDGRGDARRSTAQGVPYRDMAVLYRAHYVTRTVEEALLRGEAAVYHLQRGAVLRAAREIKDALSYLRMVAYRDDLSFRRVANVPKRNLGKRRMAFLRE